MKVLTGLMVLGCLAAQGLAAQESPSRSLAASVVSTNAHPVPSNGHGILLDGLAAEWHTTAVGQDFHFIQAAVDKYLAANDGRVHDTEMGPSVLLVYRVTQQPKYYRAAQSLHDQLAGQQQTSLDRTSLDKAYIAAAFQAAYAATFHHPEDLSDVAKRLLTLEPHTRNASAGLEQQGSYAMALVDALDWMPTDQPQRPELIAALKRTVAAAAKRQDARTGLWQMTGNADTTASASCMFVYAVAKGVRLGYLPQSYEGDARRGWTAIGKAFVSPEADGSVALKEGANDGRETGAFLLAGSEMEQAATESLGQGRTALVDAWFNSQTRQNAAGQTELFHYKWNDDSNNGFSFFGRAFQRYGVKLATEKTAPTAADLKKAQIYILASPDIPSKNPNPHYMDSKSVDVIANWVKAGGVLLLMENDGPNAEFEHFNTLSDRFGIHFNQVLVNHVIGNDYPAGKLMIPSGTGVFEHPHQAYMKDTSTISVKSPAKAVVTKDKDVMIAVAKYGKGTVFAVVDPWVYNEYVDRRNHLPVAYDNFDAAIDLAGWALKQ